MKSVLFYLSQEKGTLSEIFKIQVDDIILPRVADGSYVLVGFYVLIRLPSCIYLLLIYIISYFLTVKMGVLNFK